MKIKRVSDVKSKKIQENLQAENQNLKEQLEEQELMCAWGYINGFLNTSFRQFEEDEDDE